ncbi:MAG TPA: hypothetical protein VEA44_14055 [Caulobacter sp.]|nr:hypothetical protein [Caulobacter sp.]
MFDFKRVAVAAAAALALGLSVAASAQAQELTVAEWRREGDDERLRLYVMGIKTGYDWANEELRADGRPMLYCQPRDLAVSYDMLAKILTDFLAANPRLTDDMAMPGVILYAMKDKYPCGNPV